MIAISVNLLVRLNTTHVNCLVAKWNALIQVFLNDNLKIIQGLTTLLSFFLLKKFHIRGAILCVISL